jgi:hypothetical protein
MIIPTIEFNEFMKIYSKKYDALGFRCQSYPYSSICFFMRKKCVDLSGKVDDIRIRLGGASYDFGVPFEDYTVDYNQRGVDYCIIGISPGDFDLYILGDSFLRSYLSIYDFEASRVGLAVHKYSKATIEPLNKPLNI